MNTRRLNLLCRSLTITCAAGSAIAIAAALLLPYDLDPSARSTTLAAARVAPAATAKPAPLTLADFEPYLPAAPAQPQPATTAPAAAAAVVESAPTAPPAETVTLQLIGTVTEPDNAYAIFQTPDGPEVRRVGDSISDQTVTHISEGSATLRGPRGEHQTLRVPLPEPSNS